MGTQVFWFQVSWKECRGWDRDIAGEHSIQGELAGLQRADGRVTHSQKWAGCGPGQAGTHLGS